MSRKHPLASYETHPVGEDAGWYVSRPIRMGDNTLRVEGTSPWNRWAFESGYLGELARDELVRQQKWALRRWRWWQPEPPRLTELRWYPVRPASSAEWLAGWALTGWTAWAALRTRGRV